ncbi:MAG TPA: hypothetical protein VM283_00240, partial [Armatimonadota bacterium]|nr:hypothetical protein [Armatimonadota bacterium]
MTVGELYDFAITRGMALDPRGPGALKQWMDRTREQYSKLSGREEQLFDTERLSNPFGDTRIMFGDPDTELERVILGIDVDTPEILLAEALRARGERLDAVIGHHASAMSAMTSAEDTMGVQVEMMVAQGVLRSRAESLVREDLKKRPRPFNYRIAQVAEALGIPLMTIHTPADLHVYEFAHRQVAEHRPATVGDLVDLIAEWPEVQWAVQRGEEPKVTAGDKRNSLGKLHVHFTGGWNPTPACMEAMCEAGVETFMLMATSDALE